MILLSVSCNTQTSAQLLQQLNCYTIVEWLSGSPHMECNVFA